MLLSLCVRSRTTLNERITGKPNIDHSLGTGGKAYHSVSVALRSWAHSGNLRQMGSYGLSLGSHSARSASEGDIRLARRAGMSDAINAESPRTEAANRASSGL